MEHRNYWAIWFIWLGTSLYWTVENLWINLYWARNVDPHAFYISLMVAITAVVGVITQIIFGGISDASPRLRKGHGRSYFILVGSIMGGISMCLFPVTRLLTPIWLAVTYACVVDTMITFFGDQTTPTRIALLADTTKPMERGKVNALLSIPAGIGSIVVVVFSGYLMEMFGDDFVFYLGGVGLTLCGLTCYFLVEEPHSEPTQQSWKANVKQTFELGSVKEHPDIYILLGYIALNSFGVQIYSPYLFIYLQNTLLLDGITLTLGLGAIMGFAVLGLPAGVLADKYGRKRILSVCVPLQGVCIACVFFIRPGMFVGMVLLAGMGQAFAVAGGIAVNAWLADIVPEKRRGALLTYIIVAGVITMTPGSLFGAYLADTYASAPGVYSPLIFLFGGIFIFLSVFFVYRVKETRVGGIYYENKKEGEKNSED